MNVSTALHPDPPQLGTAIVCSPWLKLVLWLPLYTLALVGLLGWRVAAPTEAGAPPSKVVRLMLKAFDPPRYAPDPGRLPGPAGGSHRKGDGAIDVRLLALPALEEIHQPPARILPILEPELRPLDAPLTIDKSLPVRAGGNGVPRGDGAGFGRGHGDGVGDGSGQGDTALLKLIRSVLPDYSQSKEEAPLDGQLVKVRVRVGADGVPIEAMPVSGNGRKGSLRAILRAAMQWRFEVPKGFASQAPFEVFVDFSYHKVPFVSPEASWLTKVSEVKPVVIQ